MSAQVLIAIDEAPATPTAVAAASTALAGAAGYELRPARAAEAAELHALIQAHREEGHLLPRRLDELTVHASRFVVALDGGRIVACVELAPLSRHVAEIRSLVVHRDARAEGLGGRLVHEVTRRARLDGFDTLCAFTHGPGFFVRLGFSIVPHHWVREKIQVDCQDCPLFRACGQYAVVLSLGQARLRAA